MENDERDEPLPNCCCRLLRHAFDDLYDFLFSETALKMNLIIYWLFIMIQLLLSQDTAYTPLLLFIGGVAAVALACAVVGILTRRWPFLFFPFALITVFEMARFLVYVFSCFAIIFKTQILPGDWMPITLRGDNWDFLIVFCYSLISLYFSYVAQNALDVIRQYRRLLQLAERRALILERIGALQQMRRAEVVRDRPVMRNADSPPHYSVLVQEETDVEMETAEETSPPHYSHLNPLRIKEKKSSERSNA